MIAHNHEIKQIARNRETNTGQLNEIEGGFKEFFRNKGYSFQPSRSLANPDRGQILEPEFTVDHLSHLKSEILENRLPYPGEASTQDCLRTQNLYKGSFDSHINSNSALPFCLYFRMLSVTTPPNENIVSDGWEYLTKQIGLKPDDLIIKISEKDGELMETLKANGIPEERFFIMRETASDIVPARDETEARPSYFQWDYGVASGFENIFGRGLTFAVQNHDGSGYTDIGNLIAIKEKSEGKTIAWEYGFGLEVLGATLKGEQTTIRTAEISDLVKTYIGSEGDWNNHWDVVADCVVAAANIINANIKPEGTSRSSRILKDILNKAVEVGTSIGLTQEDIAVIVSDYSLLRFDGNQEVERVESLVNLYYNRYEKTLSDDPELIIQNMIKELAGQSGLNIIAQGLLGFQWVLPKYEVQPIKDIRKPYDHLTRDELADKNIEVSTAGRILSLRKQGKLMFMTIGLPGKESIQIMVNVQEDGISRNDIELLNRMIKTGDWIEVRGVLMRTKTEELTIHALELPHLLTPTLVPANAKHTGEKLTGVRTTEPEIRMTRSLEARAKLFRSIRENLDKLDFIEVETSIIESIAGGASASPFNTWINALKQPGVLRIAPELKLKPLLRLVPRVYELGKSFRNEGRDRQHNPEFTTVEGYWSYANAYQDLIPLMKSLIVDAALAVNGTAIVSLGERRIDLDQSWRQATFRELILENTEIDIDPVVHLPEKEGKALLKKQLLEKGIEIDEIDKMAMGKMLDSLYKKTVRPRIIEPTIILEYPTSIVPLARLNDQDPAYNDMFQVVAGGTELVKAYQELIDPVTQLKKFMEQAKARAQGDDEAMRINWDFMEELIKGIPPCAGFGIGLDRLLSFLLNEVDIRNIITYPLGE